MSNVLICNNCKSFWYKNTVTCKNCGSNTLTETHESNQDKIEWTLTDPDNYQFGRQIGERIYEFKAPPLEVNSMGEAKLVEDYWVQMTIELDNILPSELERVAESYYGSLDKLKEQCGIGWEWILAECYFEQESGLY